MHVRGLRQVAQHVEDLDRAEGNLVGLAGRRPQH
jgi:hypothetical protein